MTETTKYFDAHQLESYRRDGYLGVPGLFGTDVLSRLETWTREVTALPEVPGRHMVYYEDSLAHPGQRVLSRIENFCPHHAGFNVFLAESELPARVGELLGERSSYPPDCEWEPGKRYAFRV